MRASRVRTNNSLATCYHSSSYHSYSPPTSYLLTTAGTWMVSGPGASGLARAGLTLTLTP